MQYVFPLVLAAGGTALMVPLSIFLGRRLGAMDQPGARRVNVKPVSRLGGLAIFSGFAFGVAFFPGQLGLHPGIMIVASLAFLLGLLDDLYDLRPRVKFLGQVMVAALLPAVGVSIKYLTNPWGGMIALDWMTWPATILWVVALMNMINLIDGLDGLAAGISAIAAISLLFLPQCFTEPFVAVLCLLTIGCAVGFLPFNFYPARTFMGDGGAHFLGFILGVITVAGALKGQAALTLSVPVLVLAVPFFDTAFAVVRRLAKRQPIYMHDLDHLHYRLLHSGFNHRQTVLVLYLWSVVFGLGSNFLARSAIGYGTMMLVGLIACAVYGLSRTWANGRNRQGA